MRVATNEADELSDLKINVQIICRDVPAPHVTAIRDMHQGTYAGALAEFELSFDETYPSEAPHHRRDRRRFACISD